MISPSKKMRRRADRSDYGFARVRDKAFDAVHGLWLKRKSQGVMLKDVAFLIGRDTGWVSKQLSGPGNWTMRTFGELVEALDGEADIAVFGLEEPISDRPNFDAYSAYIHRPRSATATTSSVAKPPVSSAVSSPTNVESVEFEMIS